MPTWPNPIPGGGSGWSHLPLPGRQTKKKNSGRAAHHTGGGVSGADNSWVWLATQNAIYSLRNVSDQMMGAAQWKHPTGGSWCTRQRSGAHYNKDAWRTETRTPLPPHCSAAITNSSFNGGGDTGQYSWLHCMNHYHCEEWMRCSKGSLSFR